MEGSTPQHGRAMPSTLHSSSLLGDPSQIKQQLEITEPLIHAAGAELARGCWALPAGPRSCRLPLPSSPAPCPGLIPLAARSRAGGTPVHPSIRSSIHPTHRSSPRPTASRSPPMAAPHPEHPQLPPGSPGCRQPPFRLTSAGHGRGRGSGAELPPAPSEGSTCPG